MAKWYYVYFAIIILLFIYYLVFWRYNLYNLCRLKKKEVSHIINRNTSITPRNNKKMCELYDEIKAVFTKKGVCNYKRMHETILALEKQESKRKKPKLSLAVLEKLRKMIVQERPFFYLLPEDAELLTVLQNHLTNNQVQEGKNELTIFSHRLKRIEDGNRKNTTQFAIGIVLSVLGLVPLVIDLVNWILTKPT